MGYIWRVSGPLVIADKMKGSQVYEIVQIGREALIGEVIGLEGERAIIQVHEDTQELEVGEPVQGTGNILTVELGPGIVSSIYDGLQKSLTDLLKTSPFMKRGVRSFAISREKKWRFEPRVKRGEEVGEGDILGTVQETQLIEHRIMLPLGMKGRIVDIRSGEYTVEDPIASIEFNGQVTPVKMYQRWPVRKPRPYLERFDPTQLLITGMRIMDCMFPLALGGKAAVPGGFGTGKTVALQQLARWAQTQLNIYVGCGERGNEMADVLYSFRKLKDRNSDRLLEEKEVFIANTSNMPVVAREASVYVGITIAEYFRDMGYDVLLVADSTSRWAEAMREISGRLEEMPGEEGFPAYLGSRLSSFYERAGLVKCIGRPERRGSVTVAGAVSPPGADFSEPVTQNTLRLIDALYALDAGLANRRHFPAISWLTSYSLYADSVKEWWSKIDPDWSESRTIALKTLQQEAELEEIVRLVGPEALPDSDRLTLLISKMLREDFLMQSAYNEIDTYSMPKRSILMLKTILKFGNIARERLNSGMTIAEIKASPLVYRISRMKDIPHEEFEKKIQELWNDFESGLVVKRGGATC
jgi:V/A-type H+/Na+-transporting ATPase subunit A